MKGGIFYICRKVNQSKVGDFLHRTPIIPAQAGIQKGIQKEMSYMPWIPACAGMTKKIPRRLN